MVKVSIVKVGRRDREQVAAGVRRAVNLAGGFADCIRPGMLVLVKPNMVAPPPSADGGAPVRQRVRSGFSRAPTGRSQSRRP